MLEQKTIDIIKSTVPFLRENGTELTKEFYRMLFINHPELQGMFDMEKQKSGQQPTNLAEIGRAACRERVFITVEFWVVGG